MNRLQFQLIAEASHSAARAGVFSTNHNQVETPVFMPVGTQATVRGMPVDNLLEMDARVILGNTYHLLLRPGPEVFRKVGGIHKFMQWPRSVLTDSGGFQIFSLPNARQISEEGAWFRSYVDGKRILLSPEVSIATQQAISSDIMMVLDQCVPATCEHAVAQQAMELTHRWALRSFKARTADCSAALFAIVQGACFTDLRADSAHFLCEHPFDGFAIGGLAVGESKSEREDLTELTAGMLPVNRPRYLMGVGTPIDLLEAVHRGVDMFDCILPTAMAQHSWAYTSLGQLKLSRSVYKFQDLPLDPGCSCRVCRTYSRAYLHHLLKADEPLGKQLLSSHNLQFYLQLMAEMRRQIINDTFYDFYRKMRTNLVMTDEEFPVVPPKKKRRRQLPLSLGAFTVKESTAGFCSVQHVQSGETMHSVNHPDEEALQLYVEQSALIEQLEDPTTCTKPLVVWDVGLGVAHNAMTAICAVEKAWRKGGGGPQRSLQLISFERDLDALRLGLRHFQKFPHLRHGAPHALVNRGHWRSCDDAIEWQLAAGDFRQTLATATRPDIIFFDPFSQGVNPELWGMELFSQLYASIHHQAVALYTYSTSTAVRAALLGAGFFVAYGKGTGPKADTTVAFTQPAALRRKFHLLDAQWLDRWRRSSSKFPLDLAEEQRDDFCRRIESHQQWAAKTEL